MTGSRDRKKISIQVLIILIFLTPFLRGESEADLNEINEIYFDGRINNIIEKYSEDDIDNGSLEFQLIYLEALIRTGENRGAGKLIGKIRKTFGGTPGLSVLEGMKHLSEGDLIASVDIVDLISMENLNSVSLIQLKFFIELYRRNFKAAGSLLNRLRDHNSGFGKSNLYFLIASEFYRTSGNFRNLSSLYRKRMKAVKKRDDREYYSNLKLNYNLYKRKSGIYFRTESSKDRVEIPFETRDKGAKKSIILKKGGKAFSILLDTGNTSGWLIHSRDLREELRPVRGGRTIMQVGTESGKLDGFNIFCKSLGFEDFIISDLFGNYIPKPRQDFFDANLNPAMIRNRIVSLDFINNRLILRTKERFSVDIKDPEGMEVLKMPWFGYKYPMIPIICNSRNGLAIIETGAENISIRSDFASQIGISLTERLKYLSNGKVFKYSLGAVNVQLGKYIFVRNQAEVWPFVRFRNRLTGFSPHVIIGPEALEGKFIVSFIPEENILVFEYERKE